MQNNKHTQDFDLYIKKALLNAEEQPSPRVWQAIESRLGGVSKPQRNKAPLGWVALAAAAALAAVVIIPSSQNNSSLIQHTTAERLALAPVALQTPSIAPARAIKNLPSVLSVVSSEQASEPSNLASTNQAAQESEPSRVNVVSIKKAEQKSIGVTEGNGSFEDFVQEASNKRSLRISAYLSSTVGGNETAGRGAAMGAKGNSANYIENDITENSASNYSIPLSFGAGARFHLSSKLAIGIGVDFSLLSRTFSGSYKPVGAFPMVGDIHHDMQYIGIPVSVFYNVFDGKGMRFYLHGLGEAEWCLNNSYTMRASGKTVNEKVSGTQFSVGAGFGVEFRLSNLVGLYIDPSARYYFDCGHPNNVRSERPLMATFNTGLRFNF